MSQRALRCEVRAERSVRSDQLLGQPDCVFRKSVTGVFGIVTGGFGNVTGHFGDVTDGLSSILLNEA